ncbi:hypothetical protein LUZ60_016736 [Juncus effusus]|nr:hypothetical protein LUZ60_016736 [Juncus effusus]
MTSSEPSSALAQAATSLPPRHVIHDLLSTDVCVRCILRLFGVSDENLYASALTESDFISFLKERNEDSDSGSISTVFGEGGGGKSCCCLCLGVLQAICVNQREISSFEELAISISEFVKSENYEIDGFALEVSLPQIITANERSLRLYMKQKYEKEEWFKKSCEQLSVKDALKLSLDTPIQKYMNVKTKSSSFFIRLTYSHSEASEKLQNKLPKNNHDSKNRKGNESDVSICKSIDMIKDQDFSERFEVPPTKVDKPCELSITCSRTPVYIGGRYLKYSRNVSQSRWIIDDERMGESSVEELIGEKVLLECKGDTYKFHSAGREDIDVRMLGSGRPFLIEVSNARIVPSVLQVEKIAENINNSAKKLVGVRNLKLVGSEAWAMMREGESEKQKQYAAVVWISRSLSDADVAHLTSLKDLEILQKTPIRVLHRRSPLERNKIIHWMKVEKISDSTQYFLLHLCTQAGTYIKEFVHGDLGRTTPSIGSMLGCGAEILQLDVTDVKMDYFD